MYSHRLSHLTLALLLTLCGLLSVNANAQEKKPAGKPKPVKQENPRLVMTVEKRGEIVIELFPKDAPKTVAHLLELTKKKFYDGIKFHRVIPGFVAQGGDPVSKEVSADQFDAKGVGTHGSGKNVPLEVKQKHVRGTLGLARAQDPDSGDSQFFFNLVDNTSLDQMDPGYCVFGKVVKGLDVIDKIKQGDRIKSVRLQEPKEKTPGKKTAEAETPSLTPQVVMSIEKRGDLTIELLTKEAPKTVAHFLELVDQKFYDGILFHRYVKEFVIQGGDPKSKEVDGSKIADLPWEEAGKKYGLGDGGSGKTIPLEASVKHERGTLGMARDQNPDSGDSQFFFNLVDNVRLDMREPGYTVFGRIVKGMDILDTLRQGDRILSIKRVEEEKSDKTTSTKKQ